MKKILRILAVMLVLTFGAISGVGADTVTLSDMNSTATIDTASQAGMYNWTVNGVNQLYQQWFWYRIGNVAEQSIDTISTATVDQLSPKEVVLTYSNDALTVQLDYLLRGSNFSSGTADVGETISITNNSRSSIDLHFFQYSDFDLAGTAENDTVQIGTNFLGKGNDAYQNDGTIVVAETVVTPGANRFQADLFATTLNSLNDTGPTTLSNALNAGPGDVTWAFQWDKALAAGDTLLISKDKNITTAVPEPSVLLLLGLGLVGVGILRRKK